MGWMIGVIRLQFPAGARNFSLHHHCVKTSSGAHPAPYPMANGVPSLGVKQQVHEADHPPPSSTVVKNMWSYTSTPLYAFMAWCLVKHRDNFTFTIWCTKVISTAVKLICSIWNIITIYIILSVCSNFDSLVILSWNILPMPKENMQI
jgi:hypothetical protein